ILIGTQDNGTQVQTGAASLSWRTIRTGDGGAEAVGWNAAGTALYHYSVGNDFSGTARETFDVNGTLLDTEVIGDGPTPLDPGRATAGFNGMSNVDRSGDGFRPYALVENAVNHNDLLLGWDQVYTSSNQGNTVTPRQGPGAAKVTALAYGGRDANGTSVQAA